MGDLTNRLKFTAVFAIAYFLFFFFFVGWRLDHTLFLLLVSVLCLSHKYGYYLVLAWTGFAGWTMLYDAMTFLPNYKVSTVHIKDLYDLEVSLFGIEDGGRIVSLCEWFQPRLNDVLSLFCGTSYLLWMPAPMIFAVYLLWKDKPAVAQFAYAYLLANMIGIAVYYLYPAAPPWYYLAHGDVLDTTVMGSEALLSEFDRLIGIDVFRGIYSKGTNVFGAIPSLHSTYPLLCLLFAIKYRHKGFAIFFTIMAIGTWIGAVYSQHHYVIDVLLGILCALLSFGIMSQVAKTQVFKKLDDWYLRQFAT